MVGIKPAGSDLKVWITNEEEAEKEERLVTTSATPESGTMIFLKFAILSNNDGNLGDLITYVAIKGLPEDAFLAYRVRGLSLA